jgi:hypothetical protein
LFGAKSKANTVVDLTLKLLTDDNPRNDIAVCILLNAELRIINTYEKIRHLDSSTAERLKTQVNNIKIALIVKHYTPLMKSIILSPLRIAASNLVASHCLD